MRSQLTKRGKQLLGSKLSIHRRPLIPKAPPEPVPLELSYMSSWELRVYKALRKRGISFSPQVNFFGGAGILGGTRVDFLLSDRMAVIRVQGYYHTLPQARARDELQRVNLLAKGYQVIDLYEADMAHLSEALDQKLGAPVRGGV